MDTDWQVEIFTQFNGAAEWGKTQITHNIASKANFNARNFPWKLLNDSFYILLGDDFFIQRLKNSLSWLSDRRKIQKAAMADLFSGKITHTKRGIIDPPGRTHINSVGGTGCEQLICIHTECASVCKQMRMNINETREESIA